MKTITQWTMPGTGHCAKWGAFEEFTSPGKLACTWHIPLYNIFPCRLRETGWHRVTQKSFKSCKLWCQSLSCRGERRSLMASLKQITEFCCSIWCWKQYFFLQQLPKLALLVQLGERLVIWSTLKVEDKREATIELLKVEDKIIERLSAIKWKKKRKEKRSLRSSRWKRKEKKRLSWNKGLPMVENQSQLLP